ncbi:hemolysin family protein [Paenibacillus sediminis]|uniref:CBS domain containing-hemolysin-like protein n=1 Tax=Paenibacillus sediminis TaxID=664909 RepID=A0ABS4H1A8_9BACL|nr:hemolysin family protein [Paenibacillus sediminis]MBP1936313.1 CBS domain containing-hemolysin-like protein [Paenibacillus sediminis]
MESDRYVLNLFLIVLLIALSAFFVAVEFAIVKIRPSRVDQMVAEGRNGALAVKQVVSNLDGYLSTSQLGITITSLILGWLGEPTIEKILHPLFHLLDLPDKFNSVLSFVIAFVLITYVHVVAGELAPKSIAIQKAEKIALFTARPIIWFNKIAHPFIWLLNVSSNRIVKWMGIEPVSEHEEAHTEEELQIIINESFESGKINQNEYGYVSRIFAFDELLAKEIMVPRTDMVVLYTNKSAEENRKIIKEERYTRFPVVTESKDNVVGMINTKQYFLEHEDNPDLDLTSLIHPVMTVSETIPLSKLLKKMQKERSHMAILIDEYGGTSGMVTIEDILEEIVGEIRDEFDDEETSDIVQVEENHLIVDGKVLISQINDLLLVDIENEELDTIGGWLYGENMDLKEGDQSHYKDLVFTVLEKEEHRIRKLEIQKVTPVQEELSLTS